MKPELSAMKAIGNFSDPRDAHEAWGKVARELHGEFFHE